MSYLANICVLKEVLNTNIILNKQTHFLDFYQTKTMDWPLGYNKAWKGIFLELENNEV